MLPLTFRRSPRRAELLTGVAVVSILGLAVPVVGSAGSAFAAPAEQVVHVSPAGSGTAAGSSDDPVSLLGAQELVRGLNDDMAADIEVRLADGTYRLESPISLTSEDSGSNGFAVRWTAEDGAQPVISGSMAVTGWELADEQNGIYRAAVAPGSATRNLFVDGATAPRAATTFNRPGKDAFIADGLTMTGGMSFLRDLDPAALAEVEIRGVNSFTDRYSGAESISGDGATLLMEQPAWGNNIWGWDTLPSPFHEGGFHAENALAFLDAPNEWFLDSAADELYYKPADPAAIDEIQVELPRLEALLSISGSVDAPAHDIQLSGLTFSGTTWNAPTTTGGYVDQQTGGYLTVGDTYPTEGYPTFEASRPHWWQVPSAVQVAAATDVAITDSRFVALGAGGLGIGNDANAHLTGAELATQRVSVTGSEFTAIGANAITVGGIKQQAHHPGTLPDGTRDPAVDDATVAAMTVSDIRIADNRIHRIADTYTSAVGVLMTYTTGSVIEHNDVTDLPYGGINTGYGWGANDAGGSSEYQNRGLYDYQPLFSTPTTAKDNRIVGNYVARFGQMHTDLGGYYNLSANPGTLIAENFITNPTMKAFYPDEGSRNLTFDDNVLINGDWFGPNYGGPNTRDMSGTGNWVSSGGTRERADRNVRVEATSFAPGDITACAPTTIMAAAGVPASDRVAADADRPTSTVCFESSTTTVDGVTSIVATLQDPLTDHGEVALTATGPEGWVLTPTGTVPSDLPAGTAATQTWTVTAPETADPIARGAVTIAANWESGSHEAAVDVAFAAGAVQPPLVTTGNGDYIAGQAGDTFSLWEAGADMWGVNQNDDDYASIYRPDSFADGATMVATVTRQDPVNPWTKSGLVIRNDLTTPFSPGGYLALVVTPAQGLVLSSDSNNDGLLDTNAITGGVTAPVTLELSRAGDDVTGRYSKDGGATWKSAGTVSVPSASAAQDAGMVHVSHDASKFAQADFTGFSLTGVPEPTVEVDRIAGAHRYEVAVNTSQAGFPEGASTVYVASGAVFPDALSAAPAATLAGAPILLTPASDLPAGVAAEIERLGATEIVIVGGTTTVSPKVESSLDELGTVTRIGGADRYDASRNIAKAAFPDGVATAVLSAGTKFADALSAGTAIDGAGPVILVKGTDADLDAATQKLLTDLKVKSIVIAGGAESVTAGIESDAASIADTIRLGGADRYEASRAINDHFFTEADHVLLATGLKFPDALSGSTYGPRIDAPLFTVKGDCIPAETLAQIKELGSTRITLLGGESTLAPSVAALTSCTAG